MLQANKRDVRVKCRKFRNAGEATGVINRKNGENVSISLKISDLDKFLAKYGDHSNIDINLENEIIKTSIIEVQRDLLIHNAININLREI
ncbi:hypothetical protein QYB59_000944 [Clostridium perfringens]|nr:hypothetical protein [Clostridium perfringens]MDZ4991811.1 hypothetical protein [Clostridium perfringens]